MAGNIPLRSIQITRLDVKDDLTDYEMIREWTEQSGARITTFAPHVLASGRLQPVVMIDNDPAQRYTVTLRDLLLTLTTAALWERLIRERRSCGEKDL